MECDGLLADELDMLEDRQDLSQYSYDPEDRLENVTFPESQQSSQASDKTDVFLYDHPSADDDVLACLEASNETRPVMSEDTAELTVTGWLGNAEEATPVLSCQQEDPSVLFWEDVEVQVLKTICYLQFGC